MRHRYRVAALVALIGVVVATRGPSSPTATKSGAFSFAVLGDAPYYFHEELQYRVVLQDLDQHELAFVVHVGDMFWRPCSDAMYAKLHGWLDGLRHPVIYTPGDNEWFDCWERQVGGFVPAERLAHLRQVFFADPVRSLGRRKLDLVPQKALPENARWRHGPIVFATVHVIGGANGMKRFPGRTEADDAEVRMRNEADVAWVHETFAEAAATNAAAAVIAFHANPFNVEMDDDVRKAYEPFLAALAEEARRFAKPVLLLHGNDHKFTVDRPLAAAPNAVRMQVPGSPAVGWVHATVSLGPPVGFSFEKRVVPRWKYW